MPLLQEIKVPLVAVNDTSLTVVEIAYSNGHPVKKGDAVMVFETSKTTYDVEAEADGYIQYRCETDRDYEVGVVVAQIFSTAEEALATPAPTSPFAPAPISTTSSTGSSTPARSSVSISNSAPAGLAASTAGKPDHRPSARNTDPTDRPQVRSIASLPPFEGPTLFSADALELIASSGIDKNIFKGRDLINRSDVEEWLHPAPAAPFADRATINGPVTISSAGAHTAPPAKKPLLPVDPAKSLLQKLTSAKRREIEYLSEVQSTGLTSTIHVFVETRGIFTHIHRSLKYLKDSLLPVILYEVARLLQDYPLLNAYFTGEGIATYKEINAGFAIDIDKGLKVLKIAGAGEKSIQEIEAAILQLSGNYLDDTLALEDLIDITFTITDLSSEGVHFFRPLINKMNSAILGVSAIDAQLQRCALSLTFDHRVTEGRYAARFLNELKERLESYRPKDHALHRNIACFKCFKTLQEDLGGAGFARCVTPAGEDGFICQSCLKGF
jgi:pyruvate/2-oxoglutarate dehydrogenase complex dihydrolipoamide acyltransferase (E2) component